MLGCWCCGLFVRDWFSCWLVWAVLFVVTSLVCVDYGADSYDLVVALVLMFVSWLGGCGASLGWLGVVWFGGVLPSCLRCGLFTWFWLWWVFVVRLRLGGL